MNEKLKYKILIDTSDRNTKNVKLISNVDDVVLDEISGSADLLVLIQSILEKNQVVLEQVAVFEPNLGPGSFTGLKIGVTTANALNWALKRKPIKDMQMPNYGQEPNIHPTKWLE